MLRMKLGSFRNFAFFWPSVFVQQTWTVPGRQRRGGTKNGRNRLDSLAPTRPVAPQPMADGAEHIPFAGGLLHSRSVGLAAFVPLCGTNPFRNFPSCSNPQRLKCHYRYILFTI